MSIKEEAYRLWMGSACAECEQSHYPLWSDKPRPSTLFHSDVAGANFHASIRVCRKIRIVALVVVCVDASDSVGNMGVACSARMPDAAYLRRCKVVPAAARKRAISLVDEVDC